MHVPLKQVLAVQRKNCNVNNIQLYRRSVLLFSPNSYNSSAFSSLTPGVKCTIVSFQVQTIRLSAATKNRPRMIHSIIWHDCTYLCSEENGDSSSLASDKRELIRLGLPNLDRGGFVLVGVLVLLSGSRLPDLGVT